MGQNKKKAKVKPVKKSSKKQEKEVEEPIFKPSKDSNKYIKVPDNSPRDEVKVIGERVQKGDIVWSHYSTEGDKGYNFYKVLDKPTETK